jgi:hypothetical protein
MNILSILKMTVTTVSEILTVLFNGFVEGLSRAGCGVAGIWWEPEQVTPEKEDKTIPIEQQELVSTSSKEGRRRLT